MDSINIHAHIMYNNINNMRLLPADCEKGLMDSGAYGMVITSSSATPADCHLQAPFSSYRIPSTQQGHWRAAVEDVNQWIQVLNNNSIFTWYFNCKNKIRPSLKIVL